MELRILWRASGSECVWFFPAMKFSKRVRPGLRSPQ